MMACTIAVDMNLPQKSLTFSNYPAELYRIEVNIDKCSSHLVASSGQQSVAGQINITIIYWLFLASRSTGAISEVDLGPASDRLLDCHRLHLSKHLQRVRMLH